MALSSCGNFLEEYSQDTDYVSTWQDLNELLIGNCYLPVYGSAVFSQSLDGHNAGMFLHLVADELQEMNPGVYGVSTGQHENTFGYFTWQQRTGQNEAYTGAETENRDWMAIYKYINVANNVIESVVDVPHTTAEEQLGVAKVSGEAHFLRGFYYFWLANLYGKPYNPTTAASDLAVPIKTTSEVIDRKFDRNTVAEVYAQVVSDLTQAESELSKTTALKTSPYRANLVAVRLLLSRVYLYMQDWEKAASYAQLVINAHPQLQNLTTNNASFMLTTNPEHIFSMGGDDLPTMLSSGERGLKVADDLYRAYSDNDYRKSQWFWNYGSFHGLVKRKAESNNDPVSPQSMEYFDNTYTRGMTGNLSPVSSVVWLRSGEAYLNLAEAQAYSGNDAAARTALATLLAARYHAGATELAIDGLSGSDLVARIRKERRLELVLEGQRWFDLRRYAVCEPYPETTTLTHDYTYYVSSQDDTPVETRRYVLAADDPSWTLPIPTEVLQFNTGMPGNGNPWRNYTTLTNQ